MSNENKASKEVEPHIFVIFGVTGDLARRKLFPALYQLSAKGELQDKNLIVGVSRSKKYGDQSIRVLGREMLNDLSLQVDNGLYTTWCDKCLFYQPVDHRELNSFDRLATRIESLEHEHNLPGNRVFYFALPPESFLATIEGLGQAGLNKSGGWIRLVAEKPFGHDFASATELNQHVHKYFDESQIFRIDHFLGKETVQNLLVFRFGNTVFEELWSREHIESIRITVAESLGIKGRSDYYEQTGALKDMVQNHLTQLIALVAMDNPATFEASAIRYEKFKVLRQIVPVKPEDVVFGQYQRGTIDGQEVPGYTEERGVSKVSQRETYAALKLEIANWRWKGVPIYIRTGKYMPQRLTKVVVRFHSPPVSVFSPLGSEANIEPNVLVVTLQPDEGFDLQFQVKAIGQPVKLTSQKLHFRYSEVFGSLPDAYETLLLDIIRGDQTLFVSSDEVERAWQIYEPLLDKDIPVHPYAAGSWGPVESDQFLSRHGAKWMNP